MVISQGEYIGRFREAVPSLNLTNPLSTPRVLNSEKCRETPPGMLRVTDDVSGYLPEDFYLPPGEKYEIRLDACPYNSEEGLICLLLKSNKGQAGLSHNGIRIDQNGVWHATLQNLSQSSFYSSSSKIAVGRYSQFNPVPLGRSGIERMAEDIRTGQKPAFSTDRHLKNGGSLRMIGFPIQNVLIQEPPHEIDLATLAAGRDRENLWPQLGVIGKVPYETFMKDPALYGYSPALNRFVLSETDIIRMPPRYAVLLTKGEGNEDVFHGSSIGLFGGTNTVVMETIKSPPQIMFGLGFNNVNSTH